MQHAPARALCLISPDRHARILLDKSPIGHARRRTPLQRRCQGSVTGARFVQDPDAVACRLLGERGARATRSNRMSLAALAPRSPTNRVPGAKNNRRTRRPSPKETSPGCGDGRPSGDMGFESDGLPSPHPGNQSPQKCNWPTGRPRTNRSKMKPDPANWPPSHQPIQNETRPGQLGPRQWDLASEPSWSARARGG